MREYIYQDRKWPNFQWDSSALLSLAAEVRHQQGELRGRMRALGFTSRQDAVLKTLTEDVVKSSEIEGERLEPETVRSSIARRLGVDIGGLKPIDRNVEGIVSVMVDATTNYRQPLTEDRLFGWHNVLFPSGRSGFLKIAVARWRDDAHGPMQVVSGPIGKEEMHYQAPPAVRLEGEMTKFLDWFNRETTIDPVIQAGLAHLWFVTLHPFDDGNGRLARAIADMQLTRSENDSQRFYSMSAQIRDERDDYYEILKSTQRGTLDVTPWLEWFLQCLGRAIARSSETSAGALQRARFWEKLDAFPLNERQRTVLHRYLDGFEGNLTTSKYAKLAKCSQDTAHRDILDLVGLGVLIQNPAGGRSTSYSLLRNRDGE
ncbi:MAG TPA: Fic family protein [Bryobacteraceae bacterium]|jgi:Fic family protein